MRKSLAVLAAGVLGLAVAIPASPANAAPETKTSARYSLSGCDLTVTVSWHGAADATETNPVYGAMTIITGSSGKGHDWDVTRRSGKETYTFTGRATDQVTTSQLGWFVNPAAWGYADITAPCSWVYYG